MNGNYHNHIASLIESTVMSFKFRSHFKQNISFFTTLPYSDQFRHGTLVRMIKKKMARVCGMCDRLLAVVVVHVTSSHHVSSHFFPFPASELGGGAMFRFPSVFVIYSDDYARAGPLAGRRCGGRKMMVDVSAADEPRWVWLSLMKLVSVLRAQHHLPCRAWCVDGRVWRRGFGVVQTRHKQLHSSFSL